MRRLIRDIRFRTSRVSILVVLLLLGSVAGLQATPVEVRFSGTVAHASFAVPPTLQSMVAPGSPVTGRFAYDNEAEDTDSSATRGLYVYRDPSYRLEVQLGHVYVATHPQSPELWVQVLNDHITDTDPQGIDQFDVISHFQTALYPSAIIPWQLQIQLSSSIRTVFDTDALPAAPPALDPFTSSEQAYAQGQVATVTNQVPRVLINFSIDQWEEVVDEVEPRRSVLDLRRQAKIIWSDPQDGMALGVIPPEDPFIFVPQRAPGPDDPPDRGRWHGSALIEVYLKNTSDQPLSWSRDPRLWEVTFGDDAGPDPNDANDVAHLQPKGRWYRLFPGRQAKMTLPVARARPLWVGIQDGSYVVRAHYLSQRYLSRKTSRRVPEGTSRFWSGYLQAPTVTVEVKRPLRRSDRQKLEKGTP